MDLQKIRDKVVEWSNTLLNELTPKERKAIIIIILLFLIGLAVKSLRGV